MAPLVKRVVAPYFATNCWIIAPRAKSECILVDPGIGDGEFIEKIKLKVSENQLKVAAVIITHGHLDHTYSTLTTIEEFAPKSLQIHEADSELLEFPELAMGPQSRELMRELSTSMPYRSAHRFLGINRIDGDLSLELGEMRFEFLHTPGHTPGSISFVIDGEVVVTGDTLFAGSIGRTDLPRGSIAEISHSLREKIATLPGDLRVLPGHGEETTIARELSSNRYLQAAISGELR
jgi:glyoxylase-like metal-dependent hydrolase (beta-lactamase superfamily II)